MCGLPDSFQGVLDRFKQIQPKLIFSVDAVVYNGKTHDHLEKLRQVVLGLPELEKVVVIPYVKKMEDINMTDIKNRYVSRRIYSHLSFISFVAYDLFIC